MSVPNAPAGQYVPAINPTLNGATFVGAPNAPDGDFVPAVNPTLSGEREIVQTVSNAPLSTLPATTSRLVNWVPNTGPQAAVRATAPVASETAGILDAAGAVVAGSGGPPYVVGNVTVGQSLVGTTVVLTPQ